MSTFNINASSKLFIIGADEVGFGSLAGPLVVCAVKAPKGWSMAGLNDSKKLSPKKRETMQAKLLEAIKNNEIKWHLAERSNVYLDKVGVADSLKECYVECFHKLYCEESIIISDGNLKFTNLGVDHYEIVSLIKADTLIPTVMAASILAKTYRDAKMKEHHKEYPMYDWGSNMGYGSKAHLNAIDKYGPCPLHRFSYAPMRNMNLIDSRQLSLFNGQS